MDVDIDKTEYDIQDSTSDRTEPPHKDFENKITEDPSIPLADSTSDRTEPPHKDLENKITEDLSIPLADKEPSDSVTNCNIQLHVENKNSSLHDNNAELSTPKTEEGDIWEGTSNITEFQEESTHVGENLDDKREDKNNIDSNDDNKDDDKSDSEFKNSFIRSSGDKQTNSESLQDTPDDGFTSNSAAAENNSGKGKKSRKNRFFPQLSCLGGKRSNSDDECDDEVPMDPELIKRYKDDKKSDFEYFWQSYSPFSQWYKVRMTIDGKEYNCAEQYMMEQKALLMEDEDNAEIIMALNEPREQKSVGREVKNWNQDLWNENCWAIVKKGNLEKFRQNSDLLNELICTYPKILVEASPYDKVWGIGLTKDDKRAHNRAYWKGENRLGYILTEVRDQLMQEANMFSDNTPMETVSDSHQHVSKDEDNPTENPGKSETLCSTNISHGKLDRIVSSEDQVNTEDTCNSNTPPGEPDTNNHLPTHGDIETEGTETCSSDHGGEGKVEDQSKVDARLSTEGIEPETSNSAIDDKVETKL